MEADSRYTLHTILHAWHITPIYTYMYVHIVTYTPDCQELKWGSEGWTSETRVQSSLHEEAEEKRKILFDTPHEIGEREILKRECIIHILLWSEVSGKTSQAGLCFSRCVREKEGSSRRREPGGRERGGGHLGQSCATSLHPKDTIINSNFKQFWW